MNPQNTEQNNSGENSSMLDQIIAASKEEVNRITTPEQQGIPQNGTPTSNNIPPSNDGNNQPPKKVRDPMSTGTIFKLIGTLFLVGIIFFGTFLSYIVFNPSQAGFFITVFGIDPNDIARLLKSLINVSFGVIMMLVSIIFIVALFKAIWTKKEFKRKKILSWIIAVITGIIGLSILTFWAYLFDKIKNTDFTNPGGNIVVYDNDLYIYDEGRPISRMGPLKNLIGPISLRYDISQNAKQVQNGVGANITSFEIDFDGAKCETGNSKVSGSDPLNEQGIVCLFDENRVYKPVGEYVIEKRTGEEERVPIILNDIEIRGIIDIQEIKNKDGALVKTFDATRVKSLGTPRWVLDSEPKKEIKQDLFSKIPTNTAEMLGLRIFSKDDEFDRVFILKAGSSKKIQGSIDVLQNPANPQEYTLSLTGITIDGSNIIDIDWSLNNNVHICQDTRKETCIYNFNSYGNWNIQADINIIGNKKITIKRQLQLVPPLELDRHLKVTNRNGKLLNNEKTIDARTKNYIIKDITPPETITLDARDILANKPGYLLKSVKWQINDGKKSETRNGEKIDFVINRTARYYITGIYTFEKSIKTNQEDDIREATDTVLLDLERKNLTPILKVNPESGYVPIKITVDASQSQSENSEIVKFIYDFGEGRPETVGDAIQTYAYTTSGEKNITVTIIDSNNNRASTTRTVVLKDTPRTIDFSSSLSPGIMGKGVDFEATNTTGQIQDYLWNFGDNTPIEHGYNVTHTFKKPGTYTVVLTVKYLDGTERSTRKSFKVVETLE